MKKYFLLAVHATLVAQVPAFHSKVAIFDIATRQSRIVYEQDGIVEAPNWSRDGKFLLINKDGGLFRLTLDGKTDRIPLSADYRCNNDHDLSPDGKRIAFSASTPDVRQSRVFVANADGTDVRLLTPDAPSYFHGWSPDGKWLAFVGRRDGKFELFRVSADGGKEERLTAEGGYDDGPEYSPDGRHIWFNSTRTGLMQVWRMETDGSNPTQMVHEDANCWFPHVSPDGKQVVYIVYKKDEVAPGDHPANKNVEIRLVSAAGGESRTVAKLFGGQGTMNVNSWSPDSRTIAFVSYRLKT